MRPYRQAVPRQNNVSTFTLSEFNGGINNRNTQLADNQATDLANVVFEDATLVRKRYGVSFMNGSRQLTGDIKFYETYPIVQANQTTANIAVILAGTNLYVENTVVKAGVYQLHSVAVYNNIIMICVDNDLLAVDINSPSVSTANYIQVNGTKPSTPTGLRVVSPPSTFTPLQSPHVQGKTVYDYNTKTVWYEPCQFEIEDLTKGSNVVSTGLRYLAVNGARLYTSGNDADDDNVYISDIMNPYYFPVFMPIQLPPTSDVIVGLKVFHGSVIVSRMHDMYVIYGNTNREDTGDLYSLKRLNAHTGFVSNKLVQQIGNNLYFVGQDLHVYAMYTPKTDVDNLMTTVISEAVDLTKAPFNFTASKIKEGQSIFHKDMWMLLIDGRVVVYHWINRAFSYFKFGSDYKITSVGYHTLERIPVFGTNAGKVAVFNDSGLGTSNKGLYADFNMPYESFYASKRFDMGAPIYDKFFRDFYVVANTNIDTETMVRVKFEIDWADIQSDFTAKSAIAVYGKAVWGDKFFNRAVNAVNRVLVGKRGKSIRIIFRNGYDITGSVQTAQNLQEILGIKDYDLYYVISENKYYLYENYQFHEQDDADLFQPMKIFELVGQYEFREVR